MGLSIVLEKKASQGLQPRIPKKSSAFPVPPRIKQQNPEKTKAEAVQDAGENDVSIAVELADKLMELFNRELRFETHEETGIVQISIVEKIDGKVIKQIPPDMVLEIIARINDIIGCLMDVKA